MTKEEETSNSNLTNTEKKKAFEVVKANIIVPPSDKDRLKKMKIKSLIGSRYMNCGAF